MKLVFKFRPKVLVVDSSALGPMVASYGSAHINVWLHIVSGRFDNYYNQHILDELSRLLRRYRNLNKALIYSILDEFKSNSIKFKLYTKRDVPVELPFVSQKKGPLTKDDPIMRLAMAERVDTLVTRDRGLSDLVQLPPFKNHQVSVYHISEFVRRFK